MEEQKNMQQMQEQTEVPGQPMPPQGNPGTVSQPHSGYGQGMPPQGNEQAVSQPHLGYGQGMPSQVNPGMASPQENRGTSARPMPQGMSGTALPPQPGYGQGIPPQMNPGTMPPHGMPPQMNPGMVPPQINPGMVSPQMNPGYGMPSYGYPDHKQGVSDGFAIASMILGIVSILICVWFYVSLPCAVVGLILGCVYRAKGGKSGMSVAGIACSSVAIALAILVAFLELFDYLYYWL